MCIIITFRCDWRAASEQLENLTLHCTATAIASRKGKREFPLHPVFPSLSSLWITSKESYKMRQSFKTVQCSLQWCTSVCVGIILPAVQKGEGGVPYYTPYYFLTEEKNQSVFMNNIQNSQKDLNSIHLRYCQGSGPDWLKTWLQKGISVQLLTKNRVGPDQRSVYLCGKLPLNNQ